MKNEIATILYQARKKLGWSQSYVAKKLHVSQQAVSQWETGNRSVDSFQLQELIALYGLSFEVNQHELIKRQEDVFRQWTNEWKAFIKDKETILQQMNQRERMFVERMTFKHAHLFDEDDEEEGYNIDILVDGINYVIQKNDVYLHIFQEGKINEDYFSKKSTFYLDELLWEFHLVERLLNLYKD